MKSNKSSKILPVLMHVSLSGGTLEVRTGLLHRLVQFYKNNFLNDLVDTAPIKIDVSVEQAPPGYKDPPNWDYESVVRLLELLRTSDSAPARRVHDALAPLKDLPTRRYLGMGRLHKARELIKKRIQRRMQMCAGDPKKPGYPKNCPQNFRSRKTVKQIVLKEARKIQKTQTVKFQSRKDNDLNRLHIPSIFSPNELYYDDMLSAEDIKLDGDDDSGHHRYNDTMRDDAILVISNPVEAKLPSGHISIGTLRRILEARAEAARVMPTRPPPTTDTAGTPGGSDTTGTDDGNSTVTGTGTGTGDGTGTTGAGDGAEATGGTDQPGDGADGEEKPDGEEGGDEEGGDEAAEE